ncbi:MAG: hypothetical protein AAF346_09405 [Pseudomonadota bacterium]
MHRALTYIRDHWRGEHPLAWSFWINLVLIRLIIFGLEFLLRGFLDHTDFLLVAAKSIFFVVFHIIVLGWQIVGTARAAESHMQATGSSFLLWACYAGCLASLIATANVVLSTNNPVKSYDFLHTWADVQSKRRKSQYKLSLDLKTGTISFSGQFVIGVRRAFNEILEGPNRIQKVVLESPGGSVYEARGVARLLVAHRLTTHIEKTCASACTLVYLAGEKRTMSRAGRLGFHKYDFNFVNKQPHPMINLAEEHAADRRFMKSRGLSDAFLENVFAQAHSEIWFPPTAKMIEAGAVHSIGAN